jgi:hypothetical protein
VSLDFRGASRWRAQEPFPLPHITILEEMPDQISLNASQPAVGKAIVGPINAGQASLEWSGREQS